jgi:hypothetical protein
MELPKCDDTVTEGCYAYECPEDTGEGTGE